MNELLKIALALAEGYVLRRPHPTIGALAGVAAMASVAAILATCAVGCALASLWIFVLPRVGEAGAPLIVAAVLVALCLILLIGIRAMLHPRRRTPPRDTPVRELIAALVAGLAAGRKTNESEPRQ